MQAVQFTPRAGYQHPGQSRFLQSSQAFQPSQPMALKMGSTPAPITIHYSGLFLDEGNPLKTLPIPAGWKRHAHHATLEYKPTGNRFPVLQGSLTVTEIRKTAEVLYAVVQPPENVVQWLKQNNIPTPPWHITIATAPGIAPRKAKEVQLEVLNGTLKASDFEAITPTQLILPFRGGGLIADKSRTESSTGTILFTPPVTDKV
jgi:hypothetical protein